ncbi:S8 family serine peptidase [Saxibacter everestensis]|uniref:S8 family serine peptidase n=1 Tax=Saxibacter everestensis TaxID=2909229 RepID=A0ABY8QPD3_9MICO|nr:S8 family serine peptidase [Brevibacteriaceae bacterium ZFBP1038]
MAPPRSVLRHLRDLRPLTVALTTLAVTGLAFGGGITPAAADPVRDRQFWIDDYNIDEAWQISRGEGVKVAVIDSGVSAHEDLKGAVVGSRDFSGTGHNGKEPIGSKASKFHGTAVAGVVAGRGHGDDAGTIGVAPEADLLSASVWLGDGLPRNAVPQRKQVADAVRWSVDSGAKVINLSLGWNDPSWPESWDDAFQYAADRDVVVIACVGNRSQGARQAWSPSTVPGVVGVGGLTQTGKVARAETAPGIAVNLMGPGEDMAVPWYTGGYGTADGSSFASPFVAGVAALIRSAYPEMSAADVINRLYRSADPVKGHKGRSSEDKPEPTVGYGRVDPLEALESDVAKVGRNPDGSLKDWIAMHRKAESTEPEELGGNAKLESDADVSDRPDDKPSSDAQSTEAARLGPPPQSGAGPVALIGFGTALVLVVSGGIVTSRRIRRGQGRTGD